ncbi:hypothetical protein H6P81_005260 [Aristolochia fimbriata]|uniref:Uncharacterized protein n=1 Tax=Aristolochia fimbriata TaxID=158543 RepID=A0AAV7EXH9_ARIFI|nr:hypothetical protein H6P81_005260 [Aristolochia fimbriata]
MPAKFPYIFRPRWRGPREQGDPRKFSRGDGVVQMATSDTFDLSSLYACRLAPPSPTLHSSPFSPLLPQKGYRFFQPPRTETDSGSRDNPTRFNPKPRFVRWNPVPGSISLVTRSPSQGMDRNSSNKCSACRPHRVWVARAVSLRNMATLNVEFLHYFKTKLNNYDPTLPYLE